MSLDAFSATVSGEPPAYARRHVSPQERARRRRAAILGHLDGRPFTAATGLRLGLTRDGLRSTDVRRLGYGVFVEARTPSTLSLRTAAVLLTAPPTRTLRL